MSKEKLIPKLRFNKFNDNWKRCTLGRISNLGKGFTPSTKNPNFWDGDLDWLSIADMNQGKYINQTSKKITSEGCKNKEPIKKGTLLMSFKLSIGKLGILTEDMYTNEAICNFQWKDSNISTEFMYYYLSSINVMKYGSQAAKGITLNNETLNSIPVILPQYNEQIHVSNFLGLIDKKIELLINKHQYYQDYKKYLMQQIFTQKLKLDKFTEEWNWLSFEDIFKSISTKKYQIKSSEIKEHGVYEVIDQGQKDIAGYNDDKSKLFIELPIIVYGDHTTFVKFRNDPFIVGADGVKLLSLKINADMKYLYYALEHFNIKPEGYKRHFSIIKKINLPIPELDEQKYISTLFSKIDAKLKFTKEQYEKTEEFKKGLLQQMFV